MSTPALRVFRCRMPDGGEHVTRLPKFSHLKFGAKCNVAVVFGARLIVVWFERVKNGWKCLGLNPRSSAAKG